jgi:hypothetical protein
MTQGSRTPDNKRIEFAAEYLKCGSPRQAAKKCGIVERTGYDIAYELDVDPEFAERRKRLRASALDRAEAAVFKALDILSERIESAQEILGGPDGEMKVLDKAADYGKSIASLNDSLLRRQKLDDDKAARSAGADAMGAVEVVVRMANKAEPEPDAK